MNIANKIILKTLRTTQPQRGPEKTFSLAIVYR